MSYNCLLFFKKLAQNWTNSTMQNDFVKGFFRKYLSDYRKKWQK